MSLPEPRFQFGKNWQAFLGRLSEERIEQAVVSLTQLLGVASLDNQTFLDLGCGSGLFSLAAHRLGATVTSLDFDAESVACTEYLRQKYEADSDRWTVIEGSALDEGLMASLGPFDVVYSWGVLHHTGQLDVAMDRACERTRSGGRLLIAIYNDQGQASQRWLRIKQTYHRLPDALKPVFVAMVAAPYELKFALARLKNGRNPLPLADWKAKKEDRGMSVWHDWVDWVGGLPFEVASPDHVISRIEARGFRLIEQKLIGKGWGCNEYLFERVPVEQTSA